MARRYRRITKAEDARAYRAKRRTLASPGKYRPGKSVSVSDRQYKELTEQRERKAAGERRAKKKSLERLTKERKSGKLPYKKESVKVGVENRKYGRIIREAVEGITPRDVAIISKYWKNGGHTVGWDKLTDEERARAEQFPQIYSRDEIASIMSL